MVAVNKSFCILLFLLLATVGHMVQVSDASVARGYDVRPISVGLDDTCTTGLGECGENVCNEACCQARCQYQFGLLNPKGYCIRLGPNQLCYCDHIC
ncbi:hypothetical protein CASFOL_020068 [Castilleja foliolosa]|uniref:Defensin-like protein n=1 Tax=Castilleja foliolosa TaxID=1961234 RepID=A0ABD3D1T0_9LAMI